MYNQLKNVVVNVWVVQNKMKRIIFLFTIFVIYTILIISCPLITSLDKNFIMFVQELLQGIPLFIPLLPDCILYTIMIVLPIVVFSLVCFKKKIYWKIPFMVFLPLVTFLINKIVKVVVHRPRPDLQLMIHPTSFSYVSSHSLITFCLWGFLIYLVNKYFENKKLKISFSVFATLWILFVGFSRVWLGVHNSSDVIGAYLLGGLLLSIFIKCYEQINSRLKKNEEGSCSF